MTLTLPEGDFKAYLFDCDGTIADSMPHVSLLRHGFAGRHHGKEPSTLLPHLFL